MADSDDDIIEEARKRFTFAQDVEGPSRILNLEDERFGNADSDHAEWQWPSSYLTTREAEGSPALVINKTRQHCLQILNDMRQHEDDIQVRPVSGGASYGAAQVLEGICRHIAYISNASQAIDTGCWHQVFSGIGYWRIMTDYIDENSFDQEIFWRRIPDRKSVYLDPLIREYDGSDANWGIIFDDIPRAEAVAAGYLDEHEGAAPPLGVDASDWDNRETVRIAEYYRRTMKEDWLIELPPEVARTTGMAAVRRSALPPELRRAIPPEMRKRRIETPEIEWFKIAGSKIVERKPWAGIYVPIVRIVGEETRIDGVLDRKGHVRALKDPQRMYNYCSSAHVQFGALQTKTPWLAPVAATAGYEQFWNNANIDNLPWLPWNHMTEDGRPIPAPARVEPPVAAPIFLKGMEIAEHEMMMASGQYQAGFGAPSNERSGVAIEARQRQGDNATGHYLQHRATAIRYTGKIVLDLIPKIYDTKRVIQILARDGKRSTVQIDPNAPQAHAAVGHNGGPPIEGDDEEEDGAAIQAIFNPAIGKYDVVADVGPSFATARQESFNAFSQIIQHNPEAFKLLADLWLEAGDFPGADEAKERIKAMLPPEAKGGPSKEMQILQQHMREMATQGQQQIEQLHAALLEAQAKLADKQPTELDWYKAESERLGKMGNIDPEALKPIIRSLVSDVLGTPVLPVMHAHAAADQARMPQDSAGPGMEVAPDGE